MHSDGKTGLCLALDRHEFEVALCLALDRHEFEVADKALFDLIAKRLKKGS
jgi:hypothetical protein